MNRRRKGEGKNKERERVPGESVKKWKEERERE